MIRFRKPGAAVAALAMVCTSHSPVVDAQGLAYPKTVKGTQTDDYFGTTVADPYRWLEDENSPETAAWVAAQNKLTFDYLAKVPYRALVRARLDKIYNYPKYSPPFRKRTNFFFYKNTGLQNQDVLYIQKGLDGK